LRGFAIIRIEHLRFAVGGIAIHTSHGKAWAAPPAQALIRNGEAIKDERGKVAYSPPLIAFDTAKARSRFSDAAVAAVLAAYPNALECEESAA
jgi:hypothetical protein